MAKSGVRYVVEWRFKNASDYARTGWSFDTYTLCPSPSLGREQPDEGFTTLPAARKYRDESKKASSHVKHRIVEVTPAVAEKRRVVK